MYNSLISLINNKKKTKQENQLYQLCATEKNIFDLCDGIDLNCLSESEAIGPFIYSTE